MPKTLDSKLLKEKDQLDLPSCYIFLDVQFGDLKRGENGWEEEWKFLTNHPPVNPGDTTVLFDGRTYERLPLMVSSFEENTEGTLPSFAIQISNTANIMGSIVEQYDLSGKEVYMHLVFYRENPSAALTEMFYIDNIVSDRKAVTVNLALLEPFEITLPLKVFTRNEFPSIPFQRRRGFLL